MRTRLTNDLTLQTIEDLKAKKILYGHSGVVNCLLSDKGVLYSGSADNTIKIWTSSV